MITYFPTIYPDELLYSQLARYYAKSGFMAYINAAKELYVSKTVRPDMEFVNAFTPDALRMITKDMTMEEVVLHHTMFPYYGRFLPLERRQKAFQAMVSMQGNYHDLLPIPQTKDEGRFLRYCPLCSAEDRKNLGETFWHRTHQMIGLNICPTHKCSLHNSSIPIKGKAPPMLKTAEEVIPLSEEVTWSDNDLECRVAEYMAEVFHADIDMEADVVVSQLFQQYLASSKYSSTSGQQRNMGLLYNDFVKYYQSMPNNRLTELWQFRKLFINARFYFDEICLLAVFLNIPASELTNMKMPEETQQQIYEDKESARSWNDIDAATLPLVRAAIEQLHGDGFTKPRNVTVHEVERLLNLPSRRISLYLPQCYAEIKQSKESRAQHLARVIVWAVKQIQVENAPITWNKIYELTNLRPAKLKACLPYVGSYADDEMVSQLNDV